MASLKSFARSLVPLESSEAEALIEWAHYRVWRQKRLTDILVMIPNGSFLGANPKTRGITMGKLKRAGFRNGVSDYLIPVPIWRLQIPGMWLELKRTKYSTRSTEQETFMRHMQDLGWACSFAKGWVEASELIDCHLFLAGEAASKPIGNFKP